MPTPNLPCLTCIVPPASIEIVLPGGATLVAGLTSSIVGTSSELARQMFGQISSALAPILPLLDLVDAVTSMTECIKAVPSALVELDPTKLIECAPNMISAVAKVANLIPPLSLPATIKGILDTLIVALEGVKQDLEGAKLQLDRLLEAGTASQLPGNSPLVAIVACAQSLYDAVMQYTANTAAPLNRLIGLANLLLSLIPPGSLVIPCIGGLDGAPQPIIDLLEKFIQTLKVIRGILPGGLKLNLFVPKGANC